MSNVTYLGKVPHLVALPALNTFRRTRFSAICHLVARLSAVLACAADLSRLLAITLTMSNLIAVAACNLVFWPLNFLRGTILGDVTKF